MVIYMEITMPAFLGEAIFEKKTTKGNSKETNNRYGVYSNKHKESAHVRLM